MPSINANGIEIYYETRGEATAEPLLLICGLGAQMSGWPEGFLEALVAEDFFVVLYDNRDVGLSSHLDHFGVPDVGGILTGEEKSPYLLSDMASDGAALLEVLGIASAHIVGVSMGGMIAQQFAIDFPSKTKTLTSIMSTPDANTVGQATPEAMAMLLRPRSEDWETFLEEEVENWTLTAGSGYPLDVAWVKEQATRARERGRNPSGVMRHMAAIVQSPDRQPLLKELSVKALVLHGDDDPLVTPPGGEATAAALRDVRYVRYPGMGHNIPRELWSEVASQLSSLRASL